MDLLKEIRHVASVKVHYTRQQYMRGPGDAILCEGIHGRRTIWRLILAMMSYIQATVSQL